MAITGDPTQVDLPPGMKSGLVEAMSILRDVPGIGFTHFDERDVVRHPLVGRIVAAYGQADAARAGTVRRAGGKESDGSGK
jgi:phosphate starvation-inducible PhoH-like protein